MLGSVVMPPPLLLCIGTLYSAYTGVEWQKPPASVGSHPFATSSSQGEPICFVGDRGAWQDQEGVRAKFQKT
eukprot:2904001-Lingulodinium_polyedra.AAC.1